MLIIWETLWSHLAECHLNMYRISRNKCLIRRGTRILRVVEEFQFLLDTGMVIPHLMEVHHLVLDLVLGCIRMR
jgi:hypothetical protein